MNEQDNDEQALFHQKRHNGLRGGRETKGRYH